MMPSPRHVSVPSSSGKRSSDQDVTDEQVAAVVGFDALIVRKLYEQIPDRESEQHGMVRVVDEDGEDDAFPAALFVAVHLPRAFGLSSKGRLQLFGSGAPLTAPRRWPGSVPTSRTVRPGS